MFQFLASVAIVLACAAPLAAQAGTWTDLGAGLAGTHGTPVATGTGSLVGGTTVGVSLAGALENVSAWLVIGLAEPSLPFKGGTLVPSVDVLLSLSTDGAGDSQLQASWPWGLPFGLSIAFQWWVADPAGPAGYAASNGLRATTPLAPVPGSLPANWISGGDCDNDPLVQVHMYDENTFILRQSMCTDFEGPFMYLFFGKERVYMLDTGAGGIPIRETVNGIIAAWEAAHGLDVQLVVGHTHSHGDHIAGDSQFIGQPETTVVGTSTSAVINFYGFANWPADAVTLDLGGRVFCSCSPTAWSSR